MKLQLVTDVKFHELQLVAKGEAPQFKDSDLKYYKIVKVQREVEENVMIRKLKFLYESNKKYFNQDVQSTDFTSPLKNSCNKLTLDLLLERYENKDLDVFGRYI